LKSGASVRGRQKANLDLRFSKAADY